MDKLNHIYITCTDLPTLCLPLEVRRVLLSTTTVQLPFCGLHLTMSPVEESHTSSSPITGSWARAGLRAMFERVLVWRRLLRLFLLFPRLLAPSLVLEVTPLLRRSSWWREELELLTGVVSVQYTNLHKTYMAAYLCCSDWLPHN